MIERWWIACCVAVSTALLTGSPALAQGIEREGTGGYAQDGLAVAQSVFLDVTSQGDLTDLIKRGAIRVLVSSNKTSFTTERGRLAGFEYELMMEYRKYLKTRVRKRSWPVQFIFLPMPFDDLLPALAEGRGDIVAAGLTVTPEREKLAAFTRPYMKNVKEIVVAAPSVTGLETLDDLAGRTVSVRAGKSYAASLTALNEDFAARGLAPVVLDLVEPVFAKEDIFGLVNADGLDLTLADDHLARLWSQVYDDMAVRDDLVLRDGGEIAWAVRQDSPELLDSLNTFIRKSGQGTLIGNILIKRYFMRPDWFADPLDPDSQARLSELRDLLQRNGEKYGFNWLLLGALAYQESQLDHSVRSPVGAVGLMQVMPETAAAPPIELVPVDDIEKNVEAGAKYLAFVRNEYFNDPAIGDVDRVNFALASYNAGPTRINRMRRRAAKEGLDPNVWFNNVEKVVRRRVGIEPVQYVRNITRYYIEFLVMQRTNAARAEARRKLEQ